jgi:adenylate cyclase class 2
MSATFECEIKLPFAGRGEASAALAAAGASPLRARRLQRDCLLDTADGMLQRARSALRVRVESGASVLTFKGPPQPSALKVREEIEVAAADGSLMLEIMKRLGFVVVFRYEKYREEFSIGDAVVALDETPVGTFVEIEGRDAEVAAVARSLGYGPADYVLDSYRGLFARRCEQQGIAVSDMLFGGD